MLHLMGGLRDAGVTGALACVPGSEVAVAARDAGFAVHTPRLGGDLDVLALPRLRRLIRALGPDLVHVHSRRGAPLYGLLAAGSVGVPAVLSRRVDNPPSTLDRWLLNGPHCARVICISDAIAEVLARAGIRPDRLRRVASAVAPAPPLADAAATLRTRFGLAASARVLGVAAQLIPRKGQADLIAALPAIR
ncbi:MAG: glycosyltransferase, partial [Pseudomonadota bacterium]